MRGSPQNGKGVIPTQSVAWAEKRRKVILVDSLSYVVHETRLVESVRLRPRDPKTARREYLGERQDIPTFTRSVPASRVAGALEIFEDMVVIPSRQSRLPKFFALRAIIWGVM